MLRQSFLLLLSICSLMGACAAGAGAPSTATTGAGGSGGSGQAPSSSATNSSSTASSSGSTAASSSGQGGGPADTSLSMLSLNLHCLRLDGTPYPTNAERFAAIAAFIAARDVSAMTLQEVCQRPGENALDELRAAVEKSTMASWSATWALAHVAWEGTADQADEGVGLLIKGTLADSKELVHAVQGSLRRVAISATLPEPWSDVRVTSIHFEVFEEKARTMQAREMAVAALVDTDPAFGAIVAGDFNDVEGSRTHSAFLASGYLAADAGLDAAGIDHLMVHRATNLRPAAVEKVFLGAEAVSDHPGILVRLAPAVGDTINKTRLQVTTSVATNQFLSVRGNSAPLSWDLGFPLRNTGLGEFVFTSTEIAADFEFKILRDDVVWQTGPNLQGKVGTNQLVTPTF